MGWLDKNNCSQPLNNKQTNKKDLWVCVWGQRMISGFDSLLPHGSQGSSLGCQVPSLAAPRGPPAFQLLKVWTLQGPYVDPLPHWILTIRLESRHHSYRQELDGVGELVVPVWMTHCLQRQDLRMWWKGDLYLILWVPVSTDFSHTTHLCAQHEKAECVEAG